MSGPRPEPFSQPKGIAAILDTNVLVRAWLTRERRTKFYQKVEGLMEHSQARRLEKECWGLMALRSARELTSLYPTSVPS